MAAARLRLPLGASEPSKVLRFILLVKFPALDAAPSLSTADLSAAKMKTAVGLMHNFHERALSGSTDMLCTGVT